MRILHVVTGLFFLFLLTHQAAAMGCDGPKVKYYLDCQDGSCKGFKTTEGFTSEACGRSLQFADVGSEEADKIITYLQVIDQAADVEGYKQVVIPMPKHCATAVLANNKAEKESCAEYNFGIEIQPDLKPVNEWQTAVKDAAQARVQNSYRANRITNAIAFSIIVLLPMGILMLAGLKKGNLVLFILVGLLCLQTYSLLFLAFIGLFTGWLYELMGFFLLAILLEGLYFIWYQAKQTRLKQCS